jgi:integration host factor subunit alpha
VQSLSREQASKLVDATIKEICEALVRWETVKRRAFETLKLRSKRERIGRIPKTGAEAPISARHALTFKASPVLVAHVNGETIPDIED